MSLIIVVSSFPKCWTIPFKKSSNTEGRWAGERIKGMLRSLIDDNFDFYDLRSDRTKQAKKDKSPRDSPVPTWWVHFYFKSSLRDNSTLSLSLSLSPLSICPCLWHGGTFGLWGLFPILTPKALNHLRYNYPPHNYTQLCETVKEHSSLLFLVALGFISERQKLNRLAFK